MQRQSGSANNNEQKQQSQQRQIRNNPPYGQNMKAEQARQKPSADRTTYNNKQYRENSIPQKERREESSHRSGKKGSFFGLTGLIPQSLYNPETGKVLGFLSAEDLLLVALILMILDGGDEQEGDNVLLVYALLYILISEHIDLPF